MVSQATEDAVTGQERVEVVECVFLSCTLEWNTSTVPLQVKQCALTTAATCSKESSMKILQSFDDPREIAILHTPALQRWLSTHSFQLKKQGSSDFPSSQETRSFLAKLREHVHTAQFWIKNESSTLSSCAAHRLELSTRHRRAVFQSPNRSLPRRTRGNQRRPRRASSSVPLGKESSKDAKTCLCMEDLLRLEETFVHRQKTSVPLPTRRQIDKRQRMCKVDPSSLRVGQKISNA